MTFPWYVTKLHGKAKSEVHNSLGYQKSLEKSRWEDINDVKVKLPVKVIVTAFCSPPPKTGKARSVKGSSISGIFLLSVVHWNSDWIVLCLNRTAKNFKWIGILQAVCFLNFTTDLWVHSEMKST